MCSVYFILVAFQFNLLAALTAYITWWSRIVNYTIWVLLLARSMSPWAFSTRIKWFRRLCISYYNIMGVGSRDDITEVRCLFENESTCSLVEDYQRFGGKYCVHLQIRRVNRENKWHFAYCFVVASSPNCIILKMHPYFGKRLPFYMASNAVRWYSLKTPWMITKRRSWSHSGLRTHAGGGGRQPKVTVWENSNISVTQTFGL
jgi:hypothetical protein